MADIKAKGMDNTPNIDLVKSHLLAGEFSVVWKMLEREGGRAPQSIREAWDSLKTLGGSKAQGKRLGTLWEYIQGKDWQEHLMEVQDDIVQANRHTKTARPLYRGEIEVQHGKKEATRLIESGRFKQVHDT